MKAGGDFLLECRAGQQIAGQLFDGELIERHVAIEGVDDPVAIQPDVAMVVDVVAVGVGVAGQVEPFLRHPLAVAWRGKQAVDQALVGIGPVVGDEGIDLG